jgi:hypothetical protein
MMMKALELIKKTREYLDYLEEHIRNVHLAWEELQLKCKDMRFVWDDLLRDWIRREVENHDISKLSESELVRYRMVFYPAADIDPVIKPDLEEAWEHHMSKNPHHWQNWTKRINCHQSEWEVHCVHMVIDWMAMSYKFNDSARSYYEKNKDRIKLPVYAVNFIYEIFARIEKDDAENVRET